MSPSAVVNVQNEHQKLDTFYNNTITLIEQTSTPKYLKHETIGGLGSTISFVAILLRIWHSKSKLETKHFQVKTMQSI